MSRLTSRGFSSLLVTSTLLLAGSLQLSPQAKPQFSWDLPAYAQRSGGRSGGGSFRQQPRQQPQQQPRQDNNNDNYTPRDRYYDNRPVIVPGPGVYGGGYGYNSGYNSSGGGTWALALLLLIFGGVGMVLIYSFIKARFGKDQAGSGELDNERVTVSKLQVVLLAQARSLQTDLDRISTTIETDTPEGNAQLMQEAVLALLRTPENWSHVLASSESVATREEATRVFNQYSLAERRKYTVETLTNVGGRVAKAAFQVNPEKDPASYIIVTLLVGTADDKPLYDKITTRDQLEETLQKLASISPEYLLAFEVIWTPQADGDTLSYEELIEGYAEVMPI